MVEISGSPWAIHFHSKDPAVAELYRMSFETLGQVDSLRGQIYIAINILRKCIFKDMDEDVILLIEKLGLIIAHFTSFPLSSFVVAG